MAAQFDCQVCGHAGLRPIASFSSLKRVTSDCKPFAQGGVLSECPACGATQKWPTPNWLAEIASIYADYTPYYQAEGVEQIVMDSATGTLQRRSDVIVSRLKASKALAPTARVLDVGCGSGATLKAFAKEYPSAQLFGNELDSRDHGHLYEIPGFRKLYTGAPSEIDQQFDLITSVHSLEHFASPFSVLRELREKISPGGRLFVQLYNSAENPFDLLIADHLMHFTPRTLAQIVERAGFSVESLETGWVPKEMSLLARAGPGKGAYETYPELRGREKTVKWLISVAEDAAACAARTDAFGIFGTSIAATWLAGSLEGTVNFFVDEDPLRQSRLYMGKPVLSPGQVPAGSTVYLALVPNIAANVRRRLEPLGIKFVAPKPFE